MTTPFQVTGGRLAVPVTDADHVRGLAKAPVTLVEYSDFQCPYCGNAYPVLQDLLRRRPVVVRLVYRHFPLTNVHPYAEVAAEAAESAAARRRFWAMHDWLFEHQEQLHPMSIQQGAAELGLPADEVEQELSRHMHLDRIQRDFVGGVRSGVNGTPTFFINGIRHDGGHSLADLLDAVDDAARVGWVGASAGTGFATPG